jgi:hypothetical protein
MTYADWEAEERLPRSSEELTAIENQIIVQSPFMRNRLDW